MRVQCQLSTAAVIGRPSSEFQTHCGSWYTLPFDGVAASNPRISLSIPASDTLAMKFSSTRTLLVLKSLWINGGARVCR
jgi:hypothetical protein